MPPYYRIYILRESALQMRGGHVCECVCVFVNRISWRVSFVLGRKEGKEELAESWSKRRGGRQREDNAAEVEMDE